MGNVKIDAQTSETVVITLTQKGGLFSIDFDNNIMKEPEDGVSTAVKFIAAVGVMAMHEFLNGQTGVFSAPNNATN